MKILKDQYCWDLQKLCCKASGNAVAVHGDISMRNVYLNDNNFSVIPTGPEMGFNYLEMDIGWLLGELLELRVLEIIDDEKLKLVESAIIAAYVDESHVEIRIDLIERFAVLRVILHCFVFLSHLVTFCL